MLHLFSHIDNNPKTWVECMEQLFENFTVLIEGELENNSRIQSITELIVSLQFMFSDIPLPQISTTSSLEMNTVVRWRQK